MEQRPKRPGRDHRAQPLASAGKSKRLPEANGLPTNKSKRTPAADRPRYSRPQPNRESGPDPSNPGESTNPGSEILAGRNPVLEALKSGRSINRVLVAEGVEPAFAASLFKRCKEQGVPCRKLSKDQLRKIAGPNNQGVAAEMAALEYVDLDDILSAANQRGESPLIVVLDGVEDPHNLGAVIRTALCAGAHGVVLAKHRAAALTQTVMKTSAGAANYLPIARVTNISQALRRLQAAGCWICCGDMDGQPLWDLDLSGPLVLVLGGEGQGVSPLVKKNCDLVAALPMCGPVSSLNVSVSAGVLLYEAVRQRRG